MSALFWSHVDRRGPDECWPWTAARTGGRNGHTYGYHSRSRKLPGNRMIYAHRMAYCLAAGIEPGTLPSSTVVRHRCDNPICCNPAHLEIGTVADNVADKVARGRALRGEAICQAILTESEVITIKGRLAAGELQRVIAADFGVSRATISHIATGHSWKCVSA